MRLNHVLQKVYWEPWWITKHGWQDVHNIVANKLSDQATLEGAKQHVEQRPNTTIFGDPIEQMRVIRDVAIIPIKGTIFKGAGKLDKISGAVSHEDIREDLNTAVGQDVEAIVLDINSPGGTVTGTRELAERIAEINQQIPVLAFTDDLMASAAYKLAVPAEEIFVAPSAQVGSVSTIMEVVNFVEQLKELGIAVEVFTSGPFKSMGHEAVELTDEQRDFIQEQVDRLGNQFREFVMTNRPDIDEGDLQGQIFFGDEAIQRNFAGQRADTLENVLTAIR